MPITPVPGQVATGGFSATSGNVTLPAAATAGNTVLVAFGANGQSMATTAGFTQDSPAPLGTARTQIFRKSAIGAGESSWTFTTGVAAAVSWVAVEVEGMDDSTPIDVSVTSQANNSSGTSVSSGTTPLSSTYDGLLVCCFAAVTSGLTPSTMSGYTNGLAEVGQFGQPGPTNSATVALAVAAVQSLGTFSSAATNSATLTASFPGTGWAVLYTAAGARRAADLLILDGAEQGTVAGITLGGTAPTRVLDTLTGSVTADPASTRSGGYGWLLTGSAAAANWTLAAAGALPAGLTRLGQRPVFRRHFRFPTLPSADVEIWQLTDVNTTPVTYTLRFIAATGKLGLRVGTGAEQVSDQAVTAGQWFGVDLRLDLRTTAATCDWSVDYNAELSDSTPGVAQTQATGTAGTGATLSTYRVGWATASTATLHTDDGAGSGVPGHYPLGDIRVLPCKVDPAGTPSISGTAANFGVMTANGTVAAWDATNARNAVDDVPPDLSATRDALVAVTGSATDYAEIPLETYAAAANGTAIRGVRVIVAVWAASATAATMRLQANDGTTTYSLYPEADPSADNTATPVWIAAMVRGSARVDWTQAKLDALVVRFGAADATPDIGLDTVLAEVAVRAGEARTVIGTAGDVTTGGAVDPDSGAVVSATLSAAPALGGTLRWADSGGPGSQAVAAGGSYTRTFPASTDVSEVTLIEVDPDPDPDQPG